MSNGYILPIKKIDLNKKLMSTNHNFEADCENTDVYESLIDGIIYGRAPVLSSSSFPHRMKGLQSWYWVI